VLNLLNI